MASSLSQQLAQVQSLNAAQLGNAKSASKALSASYLFPAHVASTQDFSTLQSLGANGWQELLQLDSAFSKWDQATSAGNLLFGESSRGMDRLMKSKEENRELDSAVSTFLQLAGGNLLDRSTGKCIEWLVRRFRVHEYNVEVVLSAFIPYHETQEFARMMQLLELKGKPQFAFLLPVQKRAVPLPSQTLIRHLLPSNQSPASLSTLRWIIQLLSPSQLPRFRRTNVALQAFWVSTILKICSEMGQEHQSSRSNGSDDYVGVMLPTVVDATLSSQLGVDFQTGACLALCSIVSVFNFSNAVRRASISKLVCVKMDQDKVRKPILSAIVCLCLGIPQEEAEVFAADDAEKLIDGESAQRLAGKASVRATISSLSTTFDTSAFLLHLCAGLCERVDATDADDRTAAVAMLEDLMQDEVAMPDSLTERIVRNLLLTSSRTALERRPECLDMLARLRQSRPTVMDKAVSEETRESSNENAEAVWKVVRNIMALQAGLSASTLEGEPREMDSAMWLSMNNPSPSIRALALRSMISSIQKHTLLANDRSVRESYLARLSDESVEVVDVVYQSPDELLQSLTLDEVVVGISTALEVSNTGGQQESSRKLARLHLSFILQHVLPSKHCSETLSWQLFKTVFWPRLLFTRAERGSAKMVWGLLESNSSASTSGSQRRMARIVKAVKGKVHAEDWAQANVDLARALADDIGAELDDTFFLSDVEFLLEECEATRPRNQLLATLVLFQLLPLLNESRFEYTAVRVASFLDRAVSSFSLAASNISLNPPISGQAPSCDKLKEAVYAKAGAATTASQAQVYLLYQLASHLSPSTYSAITAMTDESGVAPRVYQLAISASLHQSSLSISSSILTTLFSKLGESSLTFLASIWTTVALNVDVRLAALCHAQAFFDAFTSADANVRRVDFQAVVPSLLLMLKDPSALLRSRALDCLDLILSTTRLSEEGAKGKARMELYGYDTIYGVPCSGPLKYLDTADVERFLTSLLGARASFKNDEGFVNGWLRASLSVVRGEGKREASYKKRVLEVVLSHIACWTNPNAKVLLLDAVEGLSDPSKLSVLLPLLKTAVQEGNPSTLRDDDYDAYVGLLFGAYDKSASEALETDEHGCWTLLLQGLETGDRVVQKHVANSLKRGVFAVLSESKQREVFARLANLVANSTAQLLPEVRACLTALDVQTSSLVPILYDLRNAIVSIALKGSRVKRAKVSPEDLEEETWSRAMAVLVEILEALLSRKARASAELLAELFEAVRVGIELLLSHQVSGEYLMQVGMSNLSASLALFSTSLAIPEELLSSLRVDTIVNVIKTPCKPQTFQQALLLLSALGTLAPDVVLHNAMPVFTFVGSTMMQRDDDYSFVVIEKTLNSILPPVRKDMAEKAKGGLAQLQACRSLLCVFTDAAKHVPRHRRVAFFHLLVQVMGSRFLGPVCMLLVDRHASKVSKQASIDEVQSTLQLPLSVFGKRAEEPVEQWRAMNGVWEEVIRNWTHQGEDAVELQEHIFLDCVGGLGEEHEGRRMDPIKRTVALSRFVYLAIAANADDLEEHSRQMEAEEEEEGSEQRKEMWTFIERALKMSQVANTTVSRVAMESLEAVMQIVPASILFSVTDKLLESEKESDRQSGLQLSFKSICTMSTKDREKASSYMPTVITACYRILANDKQLTRPALDTLLAVADECHPSEHAALSAGLAQLIDLARAEKEEAEQELLLEVMLKLSNRLGPRLIPRLSKLMTFCLDMLSDAGLSLSTASAILNLLASLVRAIPDFVSSHLDALLRLYVARPELQDIQSSSALLSAIVRCIPTATLLSSLFSVWESGEKASPSLHSTCLGLLERAIKSADKRAIMASYKAIFRHLATVLDARRQQLVDASHWQLSKADLAEVEDQAVAVFLKLVLKLNEATFRPLFLRICDWAMLDLAGEEDEESGGDDEVIARKVVLFKVINALLAQLGELVTNYYLNVLDGAVEVLDQAVKSGTARNQDLWIQVTKSLQLSATADKGRGSFWNESRIKAAVPSLTGQLTTDLVKGSSACESLLGDAIASLCQTVPDEASLKMTNNLLLQTTRTSQTRVKVATIRVLEKVWTSKECEETLLGLVPETVPSIAELLQEGEGAVQEQLASFVAAVEQVLGEPLQGYLQ